MVTIWPRSARFDAAVIQSHAVAIHASLWRPGKTSLILDDVDITGGQVTASGNDAVRRSCKATAIDRDGTLAAIFSSRQTVLPVELDLRRGVEYSDGRRELLPLGVFAISQIEPSWGVRFDLTGYDRARRVARNKFTNPHVIPADTGYIDAAIAMVRSRLSFPVVIERLTSNTDTTPFPLVYLETDDPWAKAQALVAAAGCEIYWDQIGRLVVRDIPGPLGSPDFAYLDGETSMLLPDTKQTISDDPGFNAVLALGESSGNSGSVPRHLAVDDNPASPTYWGSDYGHVTEVYSDPTITSGTQAELVATSRLRRRLGRNDSMGLATVPHPAHDPGDVVRIRWQGRDTTMVIDSLTMPLDIGTAASLDVRSQLALKVGVG